QIFRFEPLSRDDVRTLIQRALADKERGLGNLNVTITDDALAFLVEACDGDARRALTALEIGVRSALEPEGEAKKSTPPSPLPEGKGEKSSPSEPLAASRAAREEPLAKPRAASITFDLQLAQDSIQQKVIEFD